MRGLALIFGLLIVLLGTSPVFAEKRVALVIGNSSYRNVPTLPNPANDAAAVADLFKVAGFDSVRLQIDVGIADLRRIFSEFSDIASDSDIAVVYYAGHGIEIDGVNYLIPVDAKLVRDFDVDDEALSIDRVLRATEPARSLRLVVLDACRDNPFIKAMRRSVASRSAGRGLARIEPAISNTLIAFAAKAGSIALDGNAQNSPFTAAVLKHIATPGLDIRLAFGRVRDEVLETTSQRQEPFVYGSLGGKTVSITYTPTAAEPAQQSHVSEASAAWSATKDTKSAAVLEAFIGRYAGSFYADLARARLHELKNATMPGQPETISVPDTKKSASRESVLPPHAEPKSDAAVPRREEKHSPTKGASRSAIANKCAHWLVCATCNNPAWLRSLYNACVQRCLTRGIANCA